MTSGRITFTGNPWPLGHAISDLTMTLRGDEDGSGVRLHLHVESAAYDAEGPGRPATGGSRHGWDDPADWIGSGSSIISSTAWDNRGVQVDVDDRLGFDEIDLTGTYRVDEGDYDPSVPLEERAFGAFVIGTSVVGDHTIELTRTGANLFDLRWTGRLATTWTGETELAHDFSVDARGVRLS
ncbi:hypothetical protein GCM10027418_12880 [Mariniluteicoccus endophyticus]